MLARLILAAVTSLLEAPDSALVKVDAPDALVEISKLGDNIRVAVDADDAKVRCTIPLDGVLHALERWDWKTFDPDLIFDTLGKADNGPQVPAVVTPTTQNKTVTKNGETFSVRLMTGAPSVPFSWADVDTYDSVGLNGSEWNDQHYVGNGLSRLR